MPTDDDYRSFFENSPVGFWRTSIATGQFLMANRACAHILGFNSVDEILEAKSVDLYVDNDRKIILDQLAKENHIYDFEVEMIRRDKQRVWVSLTAHSNKDYIEGFIVDITDEKRLKEKLCNLQRQEVDRLGEIQQTIKNRLRDISITALDGKHTS